jgi:uncharacterized membrane protein YcaP (DUF421 family)
MENIFFDNWTSVLRTLIIGVSAYAGMVFLLRISGKRTLSKLNTFDFIVTVALGSTLATVLLSKDVALVDGLLAFAVLIFLQYAITWLSVRFPAVSRLVKAEPTLLVYQGKLLNEAMRRERVTEEEVLAALREQGISSLDQADAVVLETEGSLSVIQKIESPAQSALKNVRHPFSKE